MVAGCAASRFKTAQERANTVKNGMTASEVVKIIGSDPTWETGTEPVTLVWARGTYRTWNGTAQGAIRIMIKDGKAYNIPAGGVISPAAVAMYEQELATNASTFAGMNAEEAGRMATAISKKAEETAAAISKKAEEDAAKASADAESLRVLKKNEQLAMMHSTIRCKDKQSCSKSFSLAQIYVSENADQKIQVATDTIIETYNPTEDGNASIKVIRTPKSGAHEEISLTVSCKDAMSTYCITKRTRIYSGFSPFIEKGLAAQ